MWKRKQRPTPQKRIDTLIGAGTAVLGNVTFTGGLRIDGKVLGNVIAMGASLARSSLASMPRSRARSGSRTLW